jgi:hypothetical protein
VARRLYGYSALATDQYPPFTLKDVPDYPAGLDLAYPESLSRGLVLVKWWLLAIPHYPVTAVFVGGAWAGPASTGSAVAVALSGGLIGGHSPEIGGCVHEGVRVSVRR